MRPSTSSRLNPNVIWVRSLVPKEKNSADLGDLTGAQRGAGRLDHGADGDVDGAGAPRSRAGPRARASPSATPSPPTPGEGQLLTRDGQRDHDLDDRPPAGGDAVDRRPP